MKPPAQDPPSLPAWVAVPLMCAGITVWTVAAIVAVMT